MQIQETPFVEETPVRHLAHIPSDAFFLHSNQGFIQGHDEAITVANPFYQHKAIDAVMLGAKIVSTLLFAALFFTIVIMLKATLLVPLFYAVLFLGIRFPHYMLDQYSKFFNRRIVKHFQREGQILQGELVHCLGSTSSILGSQKDTFIVSMGYRFRSPSGEILSQYCVEPRPDLEGLYLPKRGTPVYILYFNDDEHYLL